MGTFPIPIEIIEELKEVKLREDISSPDQLFGVGSISIQVRNIICSKSTEVFISKKAIKHIIDQRGDEKIIYLIPRILNRPTKIVDNSKKRPNSFMFAQMDIKAHGIILEITKTTDSMNQIVSAFYIDDKTYKKLEDISGRSDVPP